MRIFFLLIALAGVALGIVYPSVVETMSGAEIARLNVYDGESFRPVTQTLAEADAPVRVLLETTTRGVYTMPAAAAHLTLTASAGGKTVLAERVVFTSQQSPQATPGEQVLLASAGAIDPVTPGAYQFVVALGDVDVLPMRKVDLVLRRNAMAVDERAQPLGYVLIALGVVGFILAITRGRGGGPSAPAGPQWGRGGSSES